MSERFSKISTKELKRLRKDSLVHSEMILKQIDDELERRKNE
jgi:hypothetical protein